MKKIFLIPIAILLFFDQYSNAQALRWVEQIGAPGCTSDFSAGPMAIDRTGNLYVTGGFGCTADFDPNAGVHLLSGIGIENLFLQKLNSSGSYIWAGVIGGAGSYINASSMTTDDSGNLYITGTFLGNIDFNMGSGTFMLVGSDPTYRSMFVVKLNSMGALIWAKMIGGAPVATAFPGIIKTDAAGNVYIAGSYFGLIDFNPGPGTNNQLSAGSYDAFILKLNNTGDYVWSRRVGDIGGDDGMGIALDGFGHLYYTGNFEGTVDFDPGAGSHLVTGGVNDGFMSKLDTAGNFIWVRTFSSTTYVRPWSGIDIDAANNIYVGGVFIGTADFDPSPGVYALTSTSAYYSAFTLKTDTAGNLIWARKIDGEAMSKWMDVDGAGNVYTGGIYAVTTDFDPGPGVFTLTIPGGGLTDNVFLQKLDSSGNFNWAGSMGGLHPSAGNCVVADNSGVYISGNFFDTIDFDPGPGVHLLIDPGGYRYAFVGKFTPGALNTAIIQGSGNNSLCIYPNPASKLINIKSDSKIEEVIVSDIIGREIRHLKSQKQQETISIDQPGVYLINVVTESGYYTRKVVVN